MAGAQRRAVNNSVVFIITDDINCAFSIENRVVKHRRKWLSRYSRRTQAERIGYIAVMLLRAAFCLLLALAVSSAADPHDSDLESLYDAHQWFELRDVVNSQSPAFYRGVVAYAFHDVRQAEKVFQSVIKAAPAGEQADDARGLLGHIYFRTGRYRRALAMVDQMLALEPDRADLTNARPLFAALSEYPKQSVAQRRSSRIRCRMNGGNLFIPLSVNGRPASYIVDTGASLSVISESEAKRLGLNLRHVATTTEDATGRQVGFDVAVASALTIGDFHLKNVPFLVFGDNQQPFADLPPDERGGLGLPVLLALQTIRWSADGTFEIGVQSERKRLHKSNICFDNAMPIAEAEFGGSKMALVLDTGAAQSHLWPRFAEDFANVVIESGSKNSNRVGGVGGTVEVQSVALPALRLRIDGLEMVLRPAHVLLQETTSDSRWYHGSIGVDLLNQARRVTIDFGSMTLTLD